MEHYEHKAIVQGLQKGDRQSWFELYELYAEQLWRNVARFMYQDAASVPDVVQETFLAAARSARHFNPRRGSLWTWLWAIAQRQVALHYRKHKPIEVLAKAQKWWSSLDGEKGDWIDGRERLPGEVLESQELATLVQHTLAELQAEYQVLLMAKYVDGATVEQIAKQIDRSPVAIRSKLARARKAFRRVFKKLAHFAPDARETTS